MRINVLGGQGERLNKKRRMKNRATAQWLARETAPSCPNCGQKGSHWGGVPRALGDLLVGTEPDGFWLCEMYYGDDGKRLPSNKEVRGAEQASPAERPSSPPCSAD